MAMVYLSFCEGRTSYPNEKARFQAIDGRQVDGWTVSSYYQLAIVAIASYVVNSSCEVELLHKLMT